VIKALFGMFGFLADSLPGRVLAALGIGFISMAAYGVAINNLVALAKTNWSGVGGTVLQIASLSGAPEGFGIILGAVVTRATMTGLSRLGKLSA
jgi:hypothetical protein